MKNQKNDKWTADKSVAAIDRILLERGLAPTVPKKKTGSKILILGHTKKKNSIIYRFS